MALTREEACKVLNLPIGASKQRAIQHYKLLSLKHFPDPLTRTAESLKAFEDISVAICFFLNYKIKEKLSLGEMLSLFQSLFFRNESTNDYEDEEGLSDSFDDDSEEDHVEADHSVETGGVKVAPQSEESDDDVKEEITECMKENAVENAKALIQEEERAKKKAEKKKSQKKRRKERKKKEKEAQKEEPVEKKVNECENEKKEDDNASTTESEEDIDPNSAFVAVIAKKKRKNNVISIPSKKENQYPATKAFKSQVMKDEDPTTRILRSRSLALRGNDMANLGHYNEAIELFSEAIKLDPGDHRFYGNRSYCYDRIGNFERALRDANKSISLVPDWPKGHFRKGRALANLKRFIEAEVCFQEVLKLDPDCDDAVKEQLNLRIIQLMDMGFIRSQAEAALEEHGTVDRALEALLSKCSISANVRSDEIFLSDDDDEIAQYMKSISRPSHPALDVKMDPSNPEGHNSLWVGNVQPQVTESMLTSLFSKYGELLSIKLMSEKFCAFINYKNPKSAGMAMRALQGVELFGVSMYIRFPTITPKDSTGAKSRVPTTTTTGLKKEKVLSTGDECYFWRTTGCIRGNNCKFKHIEKNKAIDRDKICYKS